VKVLIFDDVIVRRADDYRVDGLQLLFYEHGDDAPTVVAKERPDLVMMDFAMGEHRSGEEVIRLIRQGFDGRIVAISSDAASNRRMVEAGADDAVPKTHLRAYLSRLKHWVAEPR
jgi:CheY-like chemotaxis protein